MALCRARSFLCWPQLLAATATLATFSLAHAAGTLDPTFANGATALTGLRYLSLAVSPDGRIGLAGTTWSGSFGQVKGAEVAVFDGSGQPHAGFGTTGAARVPVPPDTYNHSADAIAFDPLGRIVVSGARLCCSPASAYTARLRTDGQPSTTYAIGSLGPNPTSRLGSAFTLALDGKSRVVVGGSTAQMGGGSSVGPPGDQPVIARLATDGAEDASFGTVGQVVLASPGVVLALALDERNGIVFAFGENPFTPWAETKVLMRLSEDGAFDTTFGSGGQTVVPAAIAAAGDTRGRMLVIAERPDASAGSRLLRYTDGRLDASFGSGGEVLLPRAYGTLTTGADGTVYAGTVSTEGQRTTLRALRIRNNGVIDTTYGSQGEAVVTFDHGVGGGTSPAQLAVDGQGRLVVAASRYNGSVPFGIQDTTVMLYRFTSNAPDRAGTSDAVEYHHAALDHYFVTTDAEEIAKLDAGVFDGWTRTGESFTVQVHASRTAMPVCRFFSGATFAPRSSHFYTPYAEECDTVAAGRAWDFEKLAFFLTPPTGAGQGNGKCASGNVALYRAFNAMHGDAPNHRYTTHASTLDAMIASGWIMEGEANTRVFACVPGPSQM